VIDGGSGRLAKSSDTATLTPEQLLDLKKLRRKTREARAAYFKAHHA
jgi:hypothetical protein